MRDSEQLSHQRGPPSFSTFSPKQAFLFKQSSHFFLLGPGGFVAALAALAALPVVAIANGSVGSGSLFSRAEEPRVGLRAAGGRRTSKRPPTGRARPLRPQLLQRSRRAAAADARGSRRQEPRPDLLSQHSGVQLQQHTPAAGSVGGCPHLHSSGW